MVTDSWWVNGRVRGVSALTSVVPTRPARNCRRCPSVCRGDRRVRENQEHGAGAARRGRRTHRAAAVRAAVARGRPGGERGHPRLQHASRRSRRARGATTRSAADARSAADHQSCRDETGPKKPVLVRAFKPMGYDCQAERGTFTLRRRTQGHLTVEIRLDVGTWSKSLLGSFSVKGVGFTARLRLPVSKRALEGGQYRIGDAAHWQKLVDNIWPRLSRSWIGRSCRRSRPRPAPRPSGSSPRGDFARHCVLCADAMARPLRPPTLLALLCGVPPALILAVLAGDTIWGEGHPPLGAVLAG